MASIAEPPVGRPEDRSPGDDAGFEMILDLSAETRDLLSRLAIESGGDEFDVIAKAVALSQIAIDARRKGQRIGLFGDDLELDREIVGL